MDRDEKLKILKQLSQTKGDKANAALTVQLEKDSLVLLNGLNYHEQKSAIESISVYAFRVYENALPMMAKFMERIFEGQFLNGASDVPTRYDPYIDLLLDLLQVIEKFRYFDLKQSILILAPLCLHENKRVREKAIEGLKACVRFDLYIFYKGEGRAGLGLYPQQTAIDYLQEQKLKFLEGKYLPATIVATELLSLSMEGNSWDYQSVTLERGAVPFSAALAKIRSDTLNFLFELYKSCRKVAEKKAIISAAFSAMAPPQYGDFTQELRSLIEENALVVLAWVKSIVPGESYPVLQKLEHDVYWRFFHGLTQAIRNSALEIRDLLMASPEYQIYRTLVGFESIFEDWEESPRKATDFAKISAKRDADAQKLAESVTPDTWREWEPRILIFSKTESDDLATFPVFYNFLTRVAKHQPDLMLGFVKAHVAELGYFQFHIFVGLWESESKNARQYFLELISRGESLAYIARVLSDTNKLDSNLIDQIFKAAEATDDAAAISQIVQVAAKQYAKAEAEAEKAHLIEGLFLPAISKLDQLRSYFWVDQIWYVKEVQDLLRGLDGKGVQVFLAALEALPDIDYHAEELLKALAAGHPAAVIQFFGNRVSARKSVEGYRAIPFSFHQLHDELSKHAALLVRTVHSWGSHDDSYFRFFGGEFVANVFPGLGENLENAILPYATSGNLSDAKFVLGILQNYEGQPFVHKLCRELIIANPRSQEVKSGVGVVLEATGVVMGEYGFSDAYANKIKEIEYWLTDQNPDVSEFAKSYVDHLKNAEERERKRSREQIELRKHKFGVREEKADD